MKSRSAFTGLNLGAKRGFTLIELLIVIAIILILIAIALPNFLAAQMRARVSREKSDMRTLALAIESLRTDRNVLLVDFWDDDDSKIRQVRFGNFGVNMLTGEPPTFITCCRAHGQNKRGGTTGLFTPLTTPVPYLTTVPIDPFAYERGDLELIDDDVLPPVSYMYHDNEGADTRLSGTPYRGVHPCFTPGGCGPPGTHGILTPLGEDHFILVGFGPDSERTHNSQIPYSPTNGTSSFGDVLYRSDVGFF